VRAPPGLELGARLGEPRARSASKVGDELPVALALGLASSRSRRASSSSSRIRASRAAIARVIGPYSRRRSSQTRIRKLTIWAPTVKGSISMRSYWPARASSAFQNGLANSRTMAMTKQ
jgi:hypothetical protein